VVDVFGQIGAGWSCWRRDGNEMDVDFHGVGTFWGRGVWWESKPLEEGSGRRGARGVTCPP
jgi:hypothetical protein